MREVVENYKDETTQNDQRIMMTTTTVVHMADTLEQLNADTETLKTTASGYGCELAALKWQQDIGLDTVLPYGLRRVVQQRTLLTKSASILTPFSAQEIQQTGGICYGNNAVSGNMILANRALLKNGNCIRLGVPGAGKSMSAKWEIGQVLLSTNDDVLILDPENEFTPMVGAFGGTMIDVSGSSAVRINAMDMEKGYADDGKIRCRTSPNLSCPCSSRSCRTISKRSIAPSLTAVYRLFIVPISPVDTRAMLRH